MSISQNFPNIDPTLRLNFQGARRLDPRITFERASIGTYVDEDGLIKTAAADEARFDHNPETGESLGLLIEEERTNIALNSEDFSTRSATTYGTKSSVTTNATIAPDGTQTADLVTTVTTTTQNRLGNLHAVTSGQYYTYSVYVKQGNKSNVSFYLGYTALINASMSFTFATETFSTSGATYLSGSAGFDKLDNGWYRIYFTASSFNSGNTYSGFLSGTTANETFYIWGEQIEVGKFPTSYISTAETFSSRASTATYYDSNGIIQTAGIDVARSNAYMPNQSGVFEPIGLLVENASANRVQYSEHSSGYWTLNNSTFNLDAAITAPDGTTGTVGKLAESTNNVTSGARIYRPGGLTSSTGGTFTSSIYAKAAERSIISIQCGPNNNYVAWFNVSSGTKLSAGSGVQNYTITPVGNGWYRCTVTAVLGNGFYYFNPGVTTLDGGGTYQNSIGSGLYIWGMQFEGGSSDTSYIPTSGSTVTRAADVLASTAVTRAADVAELTGTNFSSWFNPSKGTFFTDSNSATLQSAIDRLAYNSGSSGAFALGTGAPTSGRVYTQRYTVLSNDTIAVDVFQYNGGATDFGPIITNIIPLSADVSKVAYYTDIDSKEYAIACADNINTLSGDGGRTGDLSYSEANMMRIGYNSGYAGTFNGTISRITYFTKRLTDSQLQNLTK